MANGHANTKHSHPLVKPTHSMKVIDSQNSKNGTKDAVKRKNTNHILIVIEKETKREPANQLRARATRSGTRKEVAEGKLSTRRENKKQNYGKVAKKGTNKAKKKTPGPCEIFNEKLGDYGLEHEAEAVLDSKIEDGQRCYLVKWLGWPTSANSWEPEDNLYNSAGLIEEFSIEYPNKP